MNRTSNQRRGAQAPRHYGGKSEVYFGFANHRPRGRLCGVSTDGQSLDGQLASLKAAGAAAIFKEKISGARSDRPQLHKLLAGLRPGDVLLVTRLDRLARSTRDLLNTLDAVAKAGAAFRSVEDAWCDTSTPHGELMVTILAGLATFERHLIAARTGEGRRRAMAAGVRFGRPKVLSPFQQARGSKAA
jgi:DNA invertase Pin-like site-specific DNA recombinase